MAIGFRKKPLKRTLGVYAPPSDGENRMRFPALLGRNSEEFNQSANNQMEMGKSTADPMKRYGKKRLAGI